MSIGSIISEAAKAQVAWEKKTVYKWEKQPTIMKSKTYGTCVTYVACVLQRVGVLEPGQFVWTNGTGFGDGKVIGANSRMAVTYYKNKKSIKDIKSLLQVGDILIFNDNKSGKAGSCGHICFYNGGTYSNGIHTFTGGHIISANGKERYSRKVFAHIRIKSLPTRKTIDQLAHEVLAGKWGSGNTRKTKIINAGYDYDKVQARVNELLNPSQKKTVDVLAQEVIDGKWGSGDTRKKKLTDAGYNYDAVQKKVNELLAKKAPVKKAYSGQLPTTAIKKTNTEVINDTVRWALWIAGDNNFHYGYTNKAKGANAHHNGCYFCKTQRMKKNMLMPEHTYCCNPFVGAAWAHGGCVPKALSLCRNTNSWDFHKNSGYAKSSLFTNLGHPAKSSLKKGDVLCRDTHVALYIGNGKIVEASGGDDNVKYSSKWNNSIRVKTLTDANYKNFPRVHRFNSSVNTTMTISHGEVSNRVALWQAFLDWYFDGKVGKADGIYGDNTLKWTKEFQEKEIGKGQGDGFIGPKTLAAAAAVKK